MGSGGNTKPLLPPPNTAKTPNSPGSSSSAQQGEQPETAALQSDPRARRGLRGCAAAAEESSMK